jgi:threonine aldolase
LDLLTQFINPLIIVFDLILRGFVMKIIDLRSDTVTQPTTEMRHAMFEAEVGDDVYGEDPTVNRLEEMAAEKMGKEAAVFVASGTMGNLTAVLTHTKRGDEIILGNEAHIFWYEVGSAAAFGGVVYHTVPNDNQGRIRLNDIQTAIRDENIHFPPTVLLCLENTHNRCGGAVLTTDYTKKACDLAHKKGLKVHLDGARIFNAAVALGVPASSLAQDVDSVTFCVSKGLGAPVGSLLCGSKEYIERARKVRKMLGGGMRQAGIIAAAGIVALERMIDRLAEDHANAQKLANGLGQIRGIKLGQMSVPTNIIMFDLAPELDGLEFTNRLLKKGVKIGSHGINSFRVVTHYQISSADIDVALKHIEAVCRSLHKK